MSAAPVRLSALHHRHEALGAEMTLVDGWRLVEGYGDPASERRCAQEAAALCDLTPLEVWSVHGANLAGPEGPPIPEVGRALDVGGVLWCRTAHDQVLALAPPESHNGTELTTEDAEGRRGRGLLIESEDAALLGPGQDTESSRGSPERLNARTPERLNLTSVYTVLGLAGPRAREVLSRLTSLDLGEAARPDLSVAATSLARCRSTIIRRDSGSVTAYRLLVPRECAEFVWGALEAAGAGMGLAVVGRKAWHAVVGSW